MEAGVALMIALTSSLDQQISGASVAEESLPRPNGN